MVVELQKWRFCRNSLLLALCLSLLGFASLGGCINFGGGNEPPPDDGGEPPPTEPTARLISPTTSFGLSLLDPPVSVLYSLPDDATNASGYYQRVTGGANPQAVGARVVVAPNLPIGESEFFEFDPQAAGVGFFRVGVLYTLDGEQLTIESTAVIQVQGSPDPRFLLPDQATTSVEQGDEVFVSFDAGDPEASVQWRLFLLADGDSRSAPADRLGSQLSTGSGNQGSFRLNTASMVPGDYQLGLSATDSGFSITGTVSRGLTNRIVTIPRDGVSTPVIRVVPPDVLQPPTLSVTAPAAPGVELFEDDPFTVRFSGQVFETGGTREIEVFRDTDNSFTNGGVTIMGDNLPVTQTSFALPTNLPAGVHFIGVTIRDGVTSPVTVYAPGRVTKVTKDTLTLSVTQPTSPLPVPPGTPVNVAWNTNAPITAGTVDAFAQLVDNTGSPFGPELPMISPINDEELTTTNAQFTSPVPGRFLISVRINIRDGDELVDRAPTIIRFSSLPGIIWLGSLADTDGDIEGAIFGGVQPEDNAGSSFTSAGDQDGDGNDDFVIAARYGKSFFINPGGTGLGEAYIVYGESGASKLRGEWSLDSVGAPSGMRGLTVAGLPAFFSEELSDLDTDGLSDVQWIPDSDGDGKRELVFGFPRTNSVGFASHPLERDGQFLNGGVVILPSTNPDLADPEFFLDPVVDLFHVGQQFSNATITPDPSLVVVDEQQFDPGDPDNDVDPACVAGTDGVADTILGPSEGFVSLLAPSPLDQLDPPFEIIPPDTEPEEGICPTVLSEGACIAGWRLGGRGGTYGDTLNAGAPGSGFYPLGSQPFVPFGARLIGAPPDGRFGTSVTFSASGNLRNSVELIISAPNAQFFFDDAPRGVAFMMDNRSFWGSFEGQPPPTPHQYVIGGPGYCGGGRAPNPGSYFLIGEETDALEVVLGIDDFNGDARGDIAFGSPTANNNRGRVYVIFRRDLQIESDYVLPNLGLETNDPERLRGMLITSSLQTGLGANLASGFDFNGDGHDDLVIGAPAANGGIGEIYVIFGQTGIVTPENGYTVQQLLSDIRTRNGGPVAARITGAATDLGQFGFNVANAGDINGDGVDDLIVAAPNATPRFDPDPNDAVDELTQPGIDLDLDGVADEVPGDDRLLNAGLVYVIYGNNRLDQLEDDDFTISISQLGTTQLRGFIIAGRRAGDRIAGGDAGDTAQGGLAIKAGRGRSYGLETAGDVDGDGRADILIGSVLADSERDPTTQVGWQNAGEAYLIYGTAAP